MLTYLMSHIFGFTIVCIIFGVVLGSVIGFVAGVNTGRIQDALQINIIGAFLGSILVCITPSITAPGSLANVTESAGLGVFKVFGNLFFIAVGGVTGSLISNVFEAQLSFKWLAWLMSAAYTMMAISLFYGYLKHCPQSSYC